jgi:hypothetical protein
MKGSIHAQQLVPDSLKTPEMYLTAVQSNGDNLLYVPEQYRTPQVCLQAAISNLEAKEFITKNENAMFNLDKIYGFSDNRPFGVNKLSTDLIKKAFDDKTVNLSGIEKIELSDFTLDYDKKTNRINVKSRENRSIEKTQKPEKRKKMKL